ncbi:MAG: hypothetical protein AAGJ93_06370 [Bacteroidota bacterium]
MTFTLHNLGAPYQAEACYFKLTAAQMSFYSPVYVNQQTALQAMKELIMRLRIRAAQVIEEEQGFVISLFDNKRPVIHKAVYFASRRMAVSLLDQLVVLSEGITFPLIFVELPEKLEEIDTPDDLDFSLNGPRYNWQEIGVGTLRVEKTKPTTRGASLFNPNMSVSPAAAAGPCAPLFNILQPQLQADLPLFMGRKQEVEDLYALSRNHQLLLLYGLPRVGKSSLLRCGLANRMEAILGEMIVHSRGKEGIVASFNNTLLAEFSKLGIEQPTKAIDDPSQLLTTIHQKVNKPLFLVFDQLENLFHISVSEQERYEFFGFIRKLHEDESIPHRIILSLRESFLAPLADYEQLLPDLLTNRYRVQPLRKNSMVDVSVNLLDFFKKGDRLNVDKPELISEKVCQQLANDKGEVPFQCLQIFYQQAHQKKCAQSGGKTPHFTPESIDKLGPARDVIDDYITQEIKTLEAQLPQGEGETNPEIQQKIDDLQQSRLQCGCTTNTTAIVPLVAAGGAGAVAGGGVQRLRRLLYLTLLALLASILAFGLVYAWLQRKDPCQITQNMDSCEGYVNYLIEQGDNARCAADFKVILNERQCEVWSDYQLIEQNKTCGTYQSYYQKYQHTIVNTETVQKKLLDWQCPLVRDTVQLTVRDTTVIYNNRPTPANQLDSRINAPIRGSSKGCQLFGGKNFKQIGPLWVMTEPLEGGPYRWEDALDACAAKGWRLPCIGEIDFLLANIYRNEAENAYKMLTGNGPCSLVNPAETIDNRIDFWTGTEANDATSWTFYFDTATKTVGRESNISKSRALPCLCVKKDENNQVTGIPPCYNKSVDRRPG